MMLATYIFAILRPGNLLNVFDVIFHLVIAPEFHALASENMVQPARIG